MNTRVAFVAAALICGGASTLPAIARDNAPAPASTSGKPSRELDRWPDCVVGVATPRPDEGPGMFQVLGTGFVIDADKGLVLTAAHLLKGRDRISVVAATFGARPATTLSASDATDVALLRVDGGMVCDLDFASEEPSIGQEIFVFPNSVPESAAPHGQIVGVDDRFLRFDFALESGASGAPVLDDQGRVIGMAIVIRRKNDTKPLPGFAIPLHDLRDAVAAGQSKN